MGIERPVNVAMNWEPVFLANNNKEVDRRLGGPPSMKICKQ